MDWNDLRYLLAVHRCRSLARAAEELGVTKATASRRLAALEESLALQLVERRPDGMVLTASATPILEAALAMERAAQAVDVARATAERDRIAGPVRLTAPPWLAERVIIPALPAFRARYPDVEVKLLMGHSLLDMGAREADLALRNVRPTQGPLVSRRVGELAGCAYASALYLERRGTPTNKDDLLSHDLIAYETLGGMPGFEWFRDPPYDARIVFRANDPVGMASAASAGMGIAAVPCVIGETDAQLRRIESLGVAFSPLFLVTHEDDRDAQRVRVVAQLVEDAVRMNEAILLGRGTDLAT